MTLPEPAWRVRTRPCPFYPQGRCIFADSCNFLHTTPQQFTSNVTADHREGQTDIHFSAHTTPFKPPVISVESPQSARSSRSPRLASLLLALKDVLGDEPEDGLAVEHPAQHNSLGNTSWSVGSATFVDDSNTGTEKYLDKKSSPFPSLPSSPEIPPLDAYDSLVIDQRSFVHDSQNGDTNPGTGTPVLLRQDIDLENDTLRFEPSVQFDQPSIHTISSSPVVEGERDDEAPYVDPLPSGVRDDLLSPVEISHLQLANFVRASMDMTEFVDDNTWRPSFPLVLSPPRSPAPGSTFELLSSPFGSPSNRVLSPRLSAFIGRYSTVSSDENVEDQGARDSDLDSPQIHHVQGTARIANVSLRPVGVAVGESSDLSIACRGVVDVGDESEASAVVVEDIQEVITEGGGESVSQEGSLEEREREPYRFFDEYQEPEQCQEPDECKELGRLQELDEYKELERSQEQDEDREEQYQRVLPDRRLEELQGVSEEREAWHIHQEVVNKEEPFQRDLPDCQAEEPQDISKEHVGAEVRGTFETSIEEDSQVCLTGCAEEEPQESSSENEDGSRPWNSIEWREEGLQAKEPQNVPEEHEKTEVRDPSGEDTNKEESSHGDLPDCGVEAPQVIEEAEEVRPRVTFDEIAKEQSQEFLADSMEERPQGSSNEHREEESRLWDLNECKKEELHGIDESFVPPLQWLPGSEDTSTSADRWQPALEEVQSAIKRSSQPPIHFLQSPQIDFVENETTANSSVAIEFQDTRHIPNPPIPECTEIEPIGQPSPFAMQSPDLPAQEFLKRVDDEVSEVLPGTLVDENHDEQQLSLANVSDKEPPLLLEEEDSESIGNGTDFNNTVRLAYLEPSDEDRSGDGGSFTSLYAAYSDTSSPVQGSALSIGAHEYRSTDTTPGESSGVSTPISFTHERAFTTPPPEDRSRAAVGESPSPLPPRHSMSLSRRSSGLSSPYSIPPESGSGIANLDDVNSPVSAGESRKVPFGWRNSLISNLSSKSSRTSRTSRTITRPALESLRTPPPADEPPSLSPSPSSPIPHVSSRLKPLRLSIILNSQLPSSQSAPPHTSSALIQRQQNSGHHRISTSISSVSSNHRTSYNPSLSSRFSFMSDRMRTNLLSSDSRTRTPSPLTFDNFAQLSNFGPPLSAPVSHSHIWRRASMYSTVSQDEYLRTSSRLSETAIRPIDEEDIDDDYDEHHETHDQGPEYSTTSNEHIYRRVTPPPIPTPPYSAPVIPSARPFYHAVSTAKPTLMFAIASDDVAAVKEVLESGDAGPNDAVGPQTALEFALTNDQLVNKMEIVKTLLAYGADPRAVKQPNSVVAQRRSSRVVEGVATSGDAPEPPTASLLDDVDPALRYYVERADAPHTRRTSALIHRSFFRPLTRVRYELVGQDCVLEQLFRVLSMQSRGLSVAPIVVLLCGPSGHGKSLLARKFGSLLDVPTHTVNMTTLKSTHDLWQSHSMSPYETPTTCTLAEFLINNEGKRCVVVLDEIEKTDEKTLWSLLMPWELGRCSFEAGNRHIDVRNVVWLGTSNVGHDLVFKHSESRARPDDLMLREEYVELMGLLRPLVSERLGASVLSRVTTVLPFVPFTWEEKKAICSEALSSLGGDDARSLSVQVVETVIQSALASYCPAEGARSLYRAISNQLMDII